MTNAEKRRAEFKKALNGQSYKNLTQDWGTTPSSFPSEFDDEGLEPAEKTGYQYND